MPSRISALPLALPALLAVATSTLSAHQIAAVTGKKAKKKAAVSVAADGATTAAVSDGGAPAERDDPLHNLHARLKETDPAEWKLIERAAEELDIEGDWGTFFCAFLREHIWLRRAMFRTVR